MKSKMALFIIICFLGFLVLISHVIPIRPSVTIINYTNKSLYIYAGESIYNVDPEPDEVEKIVKAKPEVIAPGGKGEFKASFISLFRKDAAIDIGWRIGGQYEYNSTGGGGQNFILSSKEGACSLSIKIQNGFNNDTLENAPGNMCFKKIKAFKYEY
ncbi:hypothetical protein [Enterobacter bugandensis]|uniref:hypothetical protein n=1 Tax=Enterobacter bugandensis TaxID=881260 RepID=UPI001CC23885|nr:hypothetical protein [Enterobacter bugandensis]